VTAVDETARPTAEAEPQRQPALAAPRGYPFGWHCVAWADEIAVGTVTPLHYFGQEMVAFRGEDGTPHVLDAYCGHMGAHLGYGGKVVGDCIQCPFHGWQWNGDGSNACIPYSREGSKKNAHVYSYPVREWYGMLLIWWHWDRMEPTCEPPAIERLDSGRFYDPSLSRREHETKCTTWMVKENAADAYHVQYVHKAGEPPEIVEQNFVDHKTFTRLRAIYGAGKKETWLTPDGKVETELTYNGFGMGLSYIQWPPTPLEAVQITGVTPIDDENTKLFFEISAVKDPEHPEVPEGVAANFLSLQHHVLEQDFNIFRHMKPREYPNFAIEEAAFFAKLRRWELSQFPPADRDSSSD